MKKLLLMFGLIIIPFNAYADDASNISNECNYSVADMTINKFNDNNIKTDYKIPVGTNLVIHNDKGNIKQLYIVYEISAQKGKIVTDSGEEKELGTNLFLHEYVSLDKPSTTVTLTYESDVTVSEIQVYTDGDTPGDVQKWKKETSADLMIFSTHADDEQLFFAGVMPTYINQGKKVHVVYFARHDVGSYYAPNRLHEQLDGLWALGVTDYPTFGIIPDAYSLSIDVARKQMNDAGFKDEDVISFYVTELRRYKPKVILGHDEKGEYGHGQHILNIEILKQAYEKAKDPEYQNIINEAYTIPKFYIHLYDLDNKTILDYDKPLDKYTGKTAYEVSKEGYKKHLSQQYTWFTDWLNGKNNSYKSATEITKYNPAYWGLYKTEVGPDINKNDLFENIKEEIKNEETTEQEESPKQNNKKVDNEKKDNIVLSFYKKHRKESLIAVCSLIVILLVSIINISHKKR